MLLRTLSYLVSSLGLSGPSEMPEVTPFLQGVEETTRARITAPVVAEQQAKVAVQSSGLSEAGFQAYLPRLRDAALEAGVREETIDRIFPSLTFSARTVELDRQQPGGAPGTSSNPPFAPFLARHVTPALVSQGRSRFADNASALNEIGRRYGVDPAVMVATFVNRGILRLRRGDIAGAMADFDEATALNPEEPEAYLNRASALLRREEVVSAIAQFDTAIAKQTRRPALAYYGRAVAHEEAGNVRAAYRDYRRASELAPAWDQPRRELTRFRVAGQ